MGVKTVWNPNKMRTAPGPGLYTPKRQTYSASYTMRNRENGDFSGKTPGPGQYDNTKNQYYK